MPILYVTATPIGNLEDITLRAIRILREVKLIAAEDTRHTKHLLNAYNIKTPLTSYHEHNRLTKLDFILEALAQGDVALVSDAGMPGISDPGQELIAAVAEKGFAVVPIPGPSTVITAVAVSGLPTDKFVYLGFLPHKAKERRQVLESVHHEAGTLVVFEAPHRLLKSLNDIMTVLGDRKMAVCREITKIHEEIFRGTISEAIEHFTAPRGEFTLVIEGSKEKEKPEVTVNVEERLLAMRRSGLTAKEAVKQLSQETGRAKNELYQIWLRIIKE